MLFYFFCYLIFTRVAPVVAVSEIKAILKVAGDQYIGPNAKAHAHHAPAQKVKGEQTEEH